MKFFGINNFEFELVEKLLHNEHKPVVEDRLERRNEFFDAESKTTTALSLAAMMNSAGDYKEIKHYLMIAAESTNERIQNRAKQIIVEWNKRRAK